MRDVVEQSILLIYSFMSIMLKPVDNGFVVAFLVAVIYVSGMNLHISRRIKDSMILLYLGICCFFPEFLIFSPAILYSILACKRYLCGVMLCVLCIFLYWKEPWFLVFLGIGILFSGILQFQSEQYQQLSERFRMTRDSDTELNILLQEKNQTLLEKQDYEIYTATLRERNRIAREIHDNVGHMITRAILMVGALHAVNQDDAMKEPLKQLEETLNTAMTNVRESVHDLHDDSVNLKDVLEGLAQGYSFCHAEIVYDMGYSIPREVKYSFIMIVKEALNNVAKHSDATKVLIKVREHPGIYQLIIKDNGTKNRKVTMKPDMEIISGVDGIGIQNMRDRIQSLGGNIQIYSDDGFCIYITVPKKEEAA